MEHWIGAYCKKYRLQEPMAVHTTFRIGGPADCMAFPNEEELLGLLAELKRREIPFFILGSGSNLLVSDAGIRGVVLHTAGLDRLMVEDDRIRVGAGVPLSRIAQAALKAQLQGFEFAAGIPGSVGGAVVMNAGAYDGEMKDVVERTVCLDEAGNPIVLQGEEHGFGYRKSVLQGTALLVTETEIKLHPGNKEEISAEMNRLAQARREKQPLELPSAGSAFRRPEGYFAAKLIDDAGLRGLSCGGAQVSEKHTGFIVNRGGATAEDVRRLIGMVQEKVLAAFGVQLEPEIKMVGEGL